MTAASDLIRASIAALPRGYEDPWRQGDLEDTAVVSGRSGLLLMRPTYAGESLRASVAAHIALLASPDVAAAVADLLDAVAKPPAETTEQVDRGLMPLAWITRVDAAARRVEAALTRTGGA